MVGFYATKPKKVGMFAIHTLDATDGYKMFVDGGWFLVRASGTEPLIRFYAEAATPEKVSALLSAAMKLA